MLVLDIGVRDGYGSGGVYQVSLWPSRPGRAVCTQHDGKLNSQTGRARGRGSNHTRVDGSGGEHRADPSRLDAAFLMVLLLIALFSHLALGLQVVIEDYVHSWVKIPTLLAVRFACFALGTAGILATLRIAFGP
jgi:hypothetical protein